MLNTWANIRGTYICGAYIWGAYIWGAYIRVGLYSGGGAYIWNEVSVSICGGLIFGGGAYIRGLIVGDLRGIVN